MDQQELRKLIRNLMIQKSNIIKESFDDEDDDLGIYSGDFDPEEFGGEAMKAAMQDIGSEFEPLGKSKFEKNLDVNDFIDDLKRQNLNLPKDKEELAGIKKTLEKKKSHEKKFGAGSLNETGEWSGDEDDQAWIAGLQNELEWVQNMLAPGIPFIVNDIQGFDKYQGPYANVHIDGDDYKIWTTEGDRLWIENFPIDNTSKKGLRAGFEGDARQLAAAINTKYSILGPIHMNEDFDEGPQPGDIEYHYPGPEKMPTGLSKFSDIDWVAIYEMLTSGEDLSRNDMKEAGLTEEDINLLYHYNIISAYNNVTLWEENTSFETFIKQVEDAYKLGFNEQFSVIGEEREGSFSDSDVADKHFDMKSLYHYFADAFRDLSSYTPEEAAQILEATFKRDFPSLSKHLSEGYVNPDSKIDRPKDAEGQPLTHRARVEDIETGSAGRVIRFGVDDNGKLTVHVDWIGEFGGKVPSTITYPDKIVVRDTNRIVREEKEEGEAYPENNRYMFFGNLQQIQRQSGLMLKMNEEQVNGILESGHDWAQDHIATAKESMDQVFDFLMNETKKEVELDESNIRSHANGRGQNLKPGNYPKTLKRKGLKENLDQAVDIDDEVFLVVDNDFNRAHYRDLIGKTFDDAPGYAQVKLVKRNEVETPEDSHSAVEVSEDFDFAAAEREHAGQEELAMLANQAKQIVPENLIEFLVPNSFTPEADGYSFTLRIPKQANELLKDIELFVREEVGIDKQINLYTVLDKIPNKWVIEVKVKDAIK